MHTRIFSVLVVGAATLTAGCRSVTVSYPYCPTPVYLSAVDRVGADAPVSTHAEDRGSIDASVTSSERTIDDDTVTVETSPGQLTAALLKKLPVGPAVHRGEAHVRSVSMSTQAWLHIGAGSAAYGYVHGRIELMPESPAKSRAEPPAESP